MLIAWTRSVLCAPWPEGEGERERWRESERERERRRGELSDGRYLTEDQHRIGFRRWLGTSCEHLASLHSNLNGILYLYALVWIIESLDRIKLLFLHEMEEEKSNR